MTISNTEAQLIQFDDDPELLKRVMSPYKNQCQYLKETSLISEGEIADGEYLTGKATFSIPESCYIDDTGHFNAVEFNICYNQLMYYTIAKAVKEQAAQMFTTWDMEAYWRRQLPDILIVDFKSSFKRPLNSKRFYGQIEFVSSRSIKRFQYINTLIRFTDDEKGHCEGAVKLAIINS